MLSANLDDFSNVCRCGPASGESRRAPEVGGPPPGPVPGPVKDPVKLVTDLVVVTVTESGC